MLRGGFVSVVGLCRHTVVLVGVSLVGLSCGSDREVGGACRASVSGKARPPGPFPARRQNTPGVSVLLAPGVSSEKSPRYLGSVGFCLNSTPASAEGAGEASSPMVGGTASVGGVGTTGGVSTVAVSSSAE